MVRLINELLVESINGNKMNMSYMKNWLGVVKKNIMDIFDKLNGHHAHLENCIPKKFTRKPSER